MPEYTILLEIVLILITARLLGEIAGYFNIPSVIGEIFAGILLGPSILNWLHISPTIQLLAQVGIILLLFEVGLETSIGKLLTSGPKACSVAITGVVAPFLFGFLASFFLLHLSLVLSLFIASTLTATSIGVTLRVLHSIKQHESKETPIIIGAAVVDDILGVILLSALYDFSRKGQFNLMNLGKVTLFVLFFLFMSPVFARVFAFLLRKWHERSDIPGLLPTMILSFVLIFSWVANQMGAPELLGGLSVGLALSRQFFLPFGSFLRKDASIAFGKKVESTMKPIVNLFTPIFFVAIGLLLNLRAIDWARPSIYILTGTLLIVAILGKLAAGFCLTKESRLNQLIIGTAMMPRGEVGLIFAKVGLVAGILQNESYAAIILVIILTTLIPPFLLRYLYSLKAN